MNIKDKIEKSKEIIRTALDKYPNSKVAVSWGKDSMVVLHLARQIKPDVKCFTVLTPFKPQETFDYSAKMIHDWNLDCEIFGLKEIKEGTEELYKTNPNKCCDIYKVQPTRNAVKDLDAWITGLRHDEGGDLRKAAAYVEPEHKLGTAKVNPILDWSETDIWKYIAINNIPAHPWYAKGYRSLGCAPCTELIDDDEPERKGRWVGFDKNECNIHKVR